MSIMIHTRISKVRWLYSFLFILVTSTAVAQSESLSFLFVGDVMQHDGQINAARNASNGNYEYEDGFRYVKPILEKYDVRIANLEVTLAGEPYQGYPQFSAPDELAETLVSSGFNVILTANNHSCDRGSKGVSRTLDVLDELGVKHTGTFRSKAERDSIYPLMLEENGYRVAILNYTYGTNGLSVAAPLIINYIDSSVIKEDVARAKELKADYIICTMHWGTEYKLLPNNYQKRFESFCYELGVDMVIGGHPHVLQPIEEKLVDGEKKLTVWSLGNFVSNMQVRYTRGGAMVGATIMRKGDQVVLDGSEHWLVYVLKKQEGAVKQYYILPEFDYNTYRPGFIDATEQARMKEFMNDSRQLFGEHNSGCPERLVTQEIDLAMTYERILTRYYSVWVDGVKDDILLQDGIGSHLHEHVDHKGNAYILCGISETKEEAEGNLRFISDCGIAVDPKIVLVEPDKLQITTE